MAHRRAKLTVAGRELVVRRIVEGGWPTVRVAEAMGISRATAYKWLAGFRTEGQPGLEESQLAAAAVAPSAERGPGQPDSGRPAPAALGTAPAGARAPSSTLDDLRRAAPAPVRAPA